MKQKIIIFMLTPFWKDDKLKNYFDYSKSVIKQHAKSFYFSARFFPDDKRWASYAVYCFCRFVDNIVDNPRQRTESELREELDCIRTELNLAFQNGESEHPALAAFAHVAGVYNIPINLPLELIDGAEMDLTKSRYDTYDELYVFCYRVASVVGLMMTHIMGYKGGDETLKHAEFLGIGMQLTNITRDIAEDLGMNRIYLPREEMDLFNVSEADLFRANATESIRQLVESQVNRAKEYYKSSYPGISQLGGESRFAIYSASRIYSSILNEIEKNEFDPFAGRAFLTKSQKTKILITELMRTKVRAYKSS